ncbi:hypothetical protein SLS59_002560 [Nothophoma quercina]|uniref:Uncharacterized protein n=1 Tax=Nothophoma quercina TaxID=749835 RepID=A0ABR3RT21_9PLEO
MNHTANADSLEKDMERAEKDVIDWDECRMDIMGIDKNGIDFLKKSGFVDEYE